MTDSEPIVTILLIDDSVTDRTRCAGLIRNGHPGWNVLTAGGALAGLDLLSESPVDVVVSDLVMPGMDGRQLLKEMAERFPLIPVVLITSQGDDQIAADCVSMGAVNYVPKRQLAERLGTVLREVISDQEEVRTTRRVLQYLTETRCRFEFESHPEQIRSVVNFVGQRLQAMNRFSSQQIQNMSAAVREALLNSWYHGTLQVNQFPLQRSRQDYIPAAAAQAVSGKHTAVQIEFTMRVCGMTVEFTVQDTGPGFNTAAVDHLNEAPDDTFNNGNGIRRMRHLMKSVTYSPAGNSVTLVANLEWQDQPVTGRTAGR
ncbi:MAG: response regulator [Planctomycetaceae bacterium]